jgi:FixJ family two-component response regulator
LSRGGIVYVIDDDESVREAVSDLLESVHLEALAFGSTEEFFQRGRPEGRCCCLVLDVHLPGITGLQFQESLQRAGIEVPIVFITAHADVPNAIRAIRAGAIEYLTKPFQKDNLLSAVYRGLEADRASLQRQAENAGLHQRFSALTGREIEIMDLVSQGLSNKEIACKLDVSEPTVKVHRSRVMQKMQANSLADLVRMSDRLKHNHNV